jgi:GH35 family endo-1,4-beta-xylanase
MLRRAVLLGCFLVGGGRAMGMNAQELLAGADSRIEARRKADVTVELRDKQGRPIPQAKLQVRQLKHAFLFGANIFPLFEYTDLKQEATYELAFTGLLNYATLPFYWGQYEPEDGKIQARQARLEKMARWCLERHVAVKGHPLVWHNVYPKWAPMDADAAKARLKKRVQDIVPHFKGLIDRWDVVNEASQLPAMDHGELRWIKRDGALAMVTECLGWARAANPQAFLLYNDFNTGASNETLVEGLSKGKDLDAVGIQSHMHAGLQSMEDVWLNCERFGRFGKPVHYTEVSVLSGALMDPKHSDWESNRPSWPSTAEGERAQADYVEKFYTLLFSHPAVEAITWWDLMDGAWLGAPAGLLHKDLSPKPAYQRLLSLIKGKWWTRLDLQSDSKGQASLRGFLGTYLVTAETAGGKISGEFELKKGKNIWQLK